MSVRALALDYVKDIGATETEVSGQPFLVFGHLYRRNVFLDA